MKIYCQNEREVKHLPTGKCYVTKCTNKCKARAQRVRLYVKHVSHCHECPALSTCRVYSRDGLTIPDECQLKEVVQ